MNRVETLKQIISDDVYNILCENDGNIEWPIKFSHSDKLKFLDNVVKTLENLEEYKKCSDVAKIKTNLESVYESNKSC
jgi:hypothetical protein